jgi:pimeloyl-ACP methyl ester carboxylesterase
MRHPFDSATLAPTINTPAIALIADADRVIPASHAEALLAQWAGPSDTLRIDGVAHETIQNDPRFYPRVEEFIRSFGSGAER